MKTITRATLRALMSDNRKKNLKRCGYTDKDCVDSTTLYKALHEAPTMFVQQGEFIKITQTNDTAMLIRRANVVQVSDTGDFRRVQMLNETNVLYVKETLEELAALL